MDPEEIEHFIKNVENGMYLSGKQTKWHEKQKVRDLAIITLLLGTGIRVSECAGLDMDDIDLDRGMIHIVRKGNKETDLFFPDSVKKYLLSYLNERKSNPDIPEGEKALFLNRDNGRISTNSINKLVKKYAVPKIVGTKKITPHKLRASYGTQLYDKIHDVYAVAEVLGHESADTTKRYYASIKDKRKEEVGRMDIWKDTTQTE